MLNDKTCANDFNTSETNCGERRKDTPKVGDADPQQHLCQLQGCHCAQPSFRAQYLMRVANNLTRTRGCGCKLYQVCYKISGSSRARAGRFPWQQCNRSIQTNERRSAHMWFHLGQALSSPQVASLFTFITY